MRYDIYEMEKTLIISIDIMFSYHTVWTYTPHRYAAGTEKRTNDVEECVSRRRAPDEIEGAPIEILSSISGTSPRTLYDRTGCPPAWHIATDRNEPKVQNVTCKTKKNATSKTNGFFFFFPHGYSYG